MDDTSGKANFWQRITDRLFGPKLFSVQPRDLKVWEMRNASGIAPMCNCLPGLFGGPSSEPRFHTEVQDEQAEGWKLLEELILSAASRSLKEFAPGLEMRPEQWAQVVTLPTTIARLTSLRHLYLYGSHLVRIPPEIGKLAELRELDLYTSYRLHWLPFEVTRCMKLKTTRLSTRSLYGNWKYRAPFPDLSDGATIQNGSTECSICYGPINASSEQVWISLRVGTDVLPLLVNACSQNCISRLPRPAEGYVERPHRGGKDLIQPEADWCYRLNDAGSTRTQQIAKRGN